MTAMYLQRGLALLLLLAAAPAVQASVQQQQSATDSSANPIRRVVNMLQGMEKKLQAEGEREKELYEKYMCYCKNSGSTLGGSISAAETKIPQVEASLKEAVASKAQLAEDLKGHQSARDDAKLSMKKATTIREKEAKEYSAESTELKTNIGALTGAIGAVEKGMAGFLQTSNAKVVAKLAINAGDISDFDRQMLVSFLTNDQSQQYTPQSGQITGILKELKDTMVKTQTDTDADESSAISGFDGLMAAKTKEVAANTKAIEDKTVRVGNLGVEIASMKNDLEDTQEALAEDSKFLANMAKNCATKEEEWAEISKQRSLELVAIADTIKILNDDDALELFKKTLPSAASSLVEVTASSKQLARRALSIVQQARRSMSSQADRAPLDLIVLALGGKKMSFDHVFKLIDQLVSELGKEQTDDDHKKEYCEKQFDFSDDKKKALVQTVGDMEAAIEEMDEAISTLAAEIKALGEGIKALDKEVAENTETRKEENEEHTELMANNNAAKELLGFAKNRLNKFYNPKLYLAPPTTELALVQIQLHRGAGSDDEAPAPPPEAFKAYAKKGEESSGVIGMIDTLVADLDKEMTEADTQEKEAQAEYETFTKDAAAKRAIDSKSFSDKEGTKADTEVELQKTKDGKAGKEKELMATEEYIMDLHGECDWLIKNFDLRKDARAGEVDSLKKAKAVLSGADFSLVQEKAARALRGGA